MLLSLHSVNVMLESISRPPLIQRPLSESWLKARCDTQTNIACSNSYEKIIGDKKKMDGHDQCIIQDCDVEI